jgi:hypothetical protein
VCAAAGRSSTQRRQHTVSLSVTTRVRWALMGQPHTAHIGCLDPFRTANARHLAPVTVTTVNAIIASASTPVAQTSAWSRESAGGSPFVPRAGGAPRSTYPCVCALRCPRIAARPCCSSCWMCWSQPHSWSQVWWVASVARPASMHTAQRGTVEPRSIGVLIVRPAGRSRGSTP